MEQHVISYNCRGLPNYTDSLYTRPDVLNILHNSHNDIVCLQFICVWTDICMLYLFYVSEINIYYYYCARLVLQHVTVNAHNSLFLIITLFYLFCPTSIMVILHIVITVLS